MTMTRHEKSPALSPSESLGISHFILVSGFWTISVMSPSPTNYITTLEVAGRTVRSLPSLTSQLLYRRIIPGFWNHPHLVPHKVWEFLISSEPIKLRQRHRIVQSYQHLSGTSRRELPAGAVATLKQWLLSPEHFTHPYPTPQDQALLMQKTGIDKKQLKNWFTNARRRIWKPMLKKQLEQGKLAATGAGGGGVAVTGLVPGLVSNNTMTTNTDGLSNPAGSSVVGNPQAIQAMQAHYQQALQQQQQQQQQQTAYGHQQQNQQQLQQTSNQINSNNSVGCLPPMTLSASNSTFLSNNGVPAVAGNMNKTDSHAVLMELFARDQDLVRQAAEGAKLKAAAASAVAGMAMADNTNNQHHYTNQLQQQPNQMTSQHPMKIPPSRMGSVPALNSWPHFSSVSSLNNLGTLTGVKSITNMSGADLASQGNLNKKGNLAQVKSFESMGRADSYAFLEVFFDDRSNGNKNWSNHQSGSKKERDEDNDVGLNLDGDEPSMSKSNDSPASPFPSAVASSAIGAPPHPAPLPADGSGDKFGASTTSSATANNGMKRAFDDALAARGLMSVSRSSEKLTDLALPAKIRRTLSQEFMRQQKMPTAQYPSFTSSSAGPLHTQNNLPPPMQSSLVGEQQYPGQNNPGQQQQQSHPGQNNPGQQQQSHPGQNNPGQQQQSQCISVVTAACCNDASLSDPSMNNASVEVPSTTKCALCHCINVDTQLRPCGHMFHGRCLKPSLQNAMGPPTCPIDGIPMQSAVLAVPTDEPPSNQLQQHQEQPTQQKQSWDNSYKPPPIGVEVPTSSSSA